jgi:SAM-dependent methyltransferase
MRNIDKWTPSKYVYKGQTLIASRDLNEVGVASRLTVDLIAASYERYIKLHARGRLVDLGCGKAPLFAVYRNYVSDITCVDWGNSLHGSQYLDVQCDLTTTLPFKDGQFDTIILSDVLEHLPQPENLWKEMSRILADNGKVLISVPFLYWLHEQPYDYYRYTEYALKRFAELSGFRMIVLRPTGGVPEILTDICAKNLLNVPKIGPRLTATIQWLSSLFLKTKLGKSISETTGSSFPLGYFLVAEKYARVS